MIESSKIIQPTEITVLKCRDYGFKCNFTTRGDIEQVIIEFGKHTKVEHGDDYSKKELMQYILKKIEKIKHSTRIENIK